MSLKVWLPLNGDLHNLGSSAAICNNYGASVNTNGKIGSCYSFDGTDDYLSLTNINLASLPQISLTCWCNLPNNINYFFLIRGSSAHRFRLSGDGLSFRDTNNTGTIRTIAYGATIPTNEWFHLACIYNHGEIYIYINGELIKHNTTYYNVNSTLMNDLDEIRIMRSTSTSGSSYCAGKLNDFRIYDHCLSAAEVREISLGLVLHYKLDGGIYGNPNLVDGSNTASTSTNTWNFSMQVGDKTNTIEYEDGVPIVVITRGTTELSGWCFLSYNNFRRNEIKTSTTYTVSFDIKSVLAGTISFTGLLLGNATNRMTNSATAIQGVVTANEWSHIVLLCTTIADFSDITVGSLIVYMSPSTSLRATGNIMKFKNIKVEEGTIETVWCPSDSEGIDRSKIEDSSGYNHNGTILNTISISSDTPRHSCSTKLEATNSMINCGRGGMVTDSITVNFWCKYSSWGNPVSCTEGGGWNMENNGGSITFPIYISSVGYVHSKNGTGAELLPPANYANAWHMFTGTYNKAEKTVSLYIDGELKQLNIASAGNNIAYNSTNCIWIGAEATGSNTTASNGMAGLFSDFRIYCTALDADAIRQLYEVGAKVDNKHQIHTFELNENNQNEITKTGILKCSTFSEFNGMSFLKYDPNLYIEPDGSCWVRVFHHNNPESVIFASNDTFTTSVYKDADRWFNMELCNYLDKWEIIVKGKLTSTSTEYKIRWSLPANPMTCAYTDVTKDKVIWNTNGYNTVNSTWGGLFKKNSSAYLVADNNTSGGNWWGAVGAFGRHQGGIPGYGGGVTTTGYEDVYLRIDNVTFSNAVAKNTKNKIWTSSEFIEL